MKLQYFVIPLSLVWAACDNPMAGKRKEISSTPSVKLEDMVGKKIDVLIKNFGAPDYAGPPSHYQLVFEGDVQPVVVFSYFALEARVYVTHDCTVLATSGIIRMEIEREKAKQAEQPADGKTPETHKPTN